MWGWIVDFLYLLRNVIVFFYDYVYEDDYDSNRNGWYNYLSGYTDNGTALPNLPTLHLLASLLKVFGDATM